MSLQIREQDTGIYFALRNVFIDLLCEGKDGELPLKRIFHLETIFLAMCDVMDYHDEKMSKVWKFIMEILIENDEEYGYGQLVYIDALLAKSKWFSGIVELVESITKMEEELRALRLKFVPRQV